VLDPEDYAYIEQKGILLTNTASYLFCRSSSSDYTDNKYYLVVSIDRIKPIPYNYVTFLKPKVIQKEDDSVELEHPSESLHYAPDYGYLEGLACRQFGVHYDID